MWGWMSLRVSLSLTSSEDTLTHSWSLHVRSVEGIKQTRNIENCEDLAWSPWASRLGSTYGSCSPGWLQVTEWQRSRVWPDTARSVRPLPSSSRLQQHGSCLETWDPAPSYSDESTAVIKYLAKPKNNWAISWDEYFPTLLWKQDGWLIVRLLADVGFIKLISFWRNFCYFREECWEITAKKNNRAKKCKIPLHVGLLPFKFYYPLKC